MSLRQKRKGARYAPRQPKGALARLTINIPSEDKRRFEDEAKARGITVSRAVTDAALGNLDNSLLGVPVLPLSIKSIVVTLKEATLPGFIQGLMKACPEAEVLGVEGRKITLRSSSLFFVSTCTEHIVSFTVEFDDNKISDATP